MNLKTAIQYPCKYRAPKKVHKSTALTLKEVMWGTGHKISETMTPTRQISKKRWWTSQIRQSWISCWWLTNASKKMISKKLCILMLQGSSHQLVSASLARVEKSQVESSVILLLLGTTKSSSTRSTSAAHSLIVVTQLIQCSQMPKGIRVAKSWLFSIKLMLIKCGRIKVSRCSSLSGRFRRLAAPDSSPQTK